jgi:hypothetical protein
MSQVLVIAGHRLERKFGSETKVDQAQQLGRLQEAIEKQRRALASQREGIAAAKRDIEEGAAPATGETPPKAEAEHGSAPDEGSQEASEVSRPDDSVRPPQADPSAPHTGGEE